MILSRKHLTDRAPAEVAALYLAADEARWLAEDRGLSSYWEVSRILSEALPKTIAASLEFCWAHADVVIQDKADDTGYYRRLMCHTAYLREEHPDVYEAVVAMIGELRAARACAVEAA